MKPAKRTQMLNIARTSIQGAAFRKVERLERQKHESDRRPAAVEIPIET